MYGVKEIGCRRSFCNPGGKERLDLKKILLKIGLAHIVPSCPKLGKTQRDASRRFDDDSHPTYSREGFSWAFFMSSTFSKHGIVQLAAVFFRFLTKKLKDLTPWLWKLQISNRQPRIQNQTQTRHPEILQN